MARLLKFYSCLLFIGIALVVFAISSGKSWLIPLAVLSIFNIALNVTTVIRCWSTPGAIEVVRVTHCRSCDAATVGAVNDDDDDDGEYRAW